VTAAQSAAAAASAAAKQRGGSEPRKASTAGSHPTTSSGGKGGAVKVAAHRLPDTSQWDTPAGPGWTSDVPSTVPQSGGDASSVESSDAAGGAAPPPAARPYSCGGSGAGGDSRGSSGGAAPAGTNSPGSGVQSSSGGAGGGDKDPALAAPPGDGGVSSDGPLTDVSSETAPSTDGTGGGVPGTQAQGGGAPGSPFGVLVAPRSAPSAGPLSLVARGASADAAPADAAAFLDRANRYRGAHGARPLAWDAVLASGASAFARTCPQGHSGAPGVGETLAWGQRGPAEAVDSWYSEVGALPRRGRLGAARLP
jgi:hypothetical protein